MKTKKHIESTSRKTKQTKKLIKTNAEKNDTIVTTSTVPLPVRILVFSSVNGDLDIKSDSELLDKPQKIMDVLSRGTDNYFLIFLF